MSNPPNVRERRLHQRYTVEGPISLGHGAESALLRDVSMSGFSCISPLRFDEMAVLEVQMHLPYPDGRSVPFAASGAVVRCTPNEDSSGFQLAVFFTFMDARNSRVLEDFIRGQAAA